MASIRERVKKSGAKSWAVLWRDRETGTQTSMTFPRLSEAETLKRLLDANGQSFAAAEKILASAASRAPRVTEMLERHIDMLTRANDGTTTRYKNIARDHIAPTLGALAVDAVDAEDIARWVKQQSAAGATRKSIANRMGLLSSAFKTAVRKGWCTANPCDEVALPDDQRPGRRAMFLTRSEYETLRGGAPERFRILCDLLVGTGLRYGEATALGWDDLVLDAETPYIRVSATSRASAQYRWTPFGSSLMRSRLTLDDFSMMFSMPSRMKDGDTPHPRASAPTTPTVIRSMSRPPLHS